MTSSSKCLGYTMEVMNVLFFLEDLVASTGWNVGENWGEEGRIISQGWAMYEVRGCDNSQKIELYQVFL